jgi:hypothetical protein
MSSESTGNREHKRNVLSSANRAHSFHARAGCLFWRTRDRRNHARFAVCLALLDAHQSGDRSAGSHQQTAITFALRIGFCPPF